MGAVWEEPPSQTTYSAQVPVMHPLYTFIEFPLCVRHSAEFWGSRDE
jgi:hypothetical protein